MENDTISSAGESSHEGVSATSEGSGESANGSWPSWVDGVVVGGGGGGGGFAGPGAADSSSQQWRAFAFELGLTVVTYGIIMVGAHYIAKIFDPNRQNEEAQKKAHAELRERWERERGTPFPGFTQHEQAVMVDLVAPRSLAHGFEAVGGLARVKQRLSELVLLPLRSPSLFARGTGSLVQVPKGILLYGPPGTGKTMLVRALAHEAGPRVSFINLKISTMVSKWYGESSKVGFALGLGERSERRERGRDR